MTSREKVRLDLYRYTKSATLGAFIKAFVLIPGFRFSYFFRKGSEYSPGSVRGRIFQIICRHYSIKFGFQISPGTSIGAGLYLGHWGQVVVNPNAVIGENCNIAQGVTIGQSNRGKRKGAPTIGDHVWIGANAVIVGDISIGRNVLIAPNSFVNFDVPDDSIVVTQQCRVIQDDDATAGYINNICEDQPRNRPSK